MLSYIHIVLLYISERAEKSRAQGRNIYIYIYIARVRYSDADIREKKSEPLLNRSIYTASI